MTIFAYRILDSRGAPATGQIEGDNKAAVIFVNIVEGDHFKQVDEINN